ncbi:hypothetical protein [Burkholderia ubonensis]|uniref:hypothetical protein n=1 Tax=Burkholderia ubonensis TaxID=101571 RepID=UPI0012FC4095|nr:hypothetical protein [Burkholderia ubonensis]
MARLRAASPISADNINLLVGGNLIEQFGQNPVIGEVLIDHKRRTQHTRFRVEPHAHLAPERRLINGAAIALQPTSQKPGIRSICEFGFIDPHRHIAPIDQAGVVGWPIPNAVALLTLTHRVRILVHLLGRQKNRSRLSVQIF